jgi:DNA-binding NarL/FixJ family response regulator
MEASLLEHRVGVLNRAPRCMVTAINGAEALGARVAAALADAGLPARWPVATVDEVARRGRSLDSDVVILAGDLRRPVTVASLRRMRRIRPDGTVLVVSSFPQALGARRALNAGAAGLVEAADLDRALLATVLAVHAGQVCAPQRGRRALAKPSFSAREKQVIALVVTGATNAEIAARLYLSESTIKSHLASLFDKLGVRSRQDAVALILDPEEGLRDTALPAVLPGPAEVL